MADALCKETMRSVRFAVCLLLAVLCVAVTGQGDDPYVIRRTNYGLVRGRKTDLAQMFLGIPYARPPARWESPREPEVRTGVMDATAVKPMCYQPENCHDVMPLGACQPEMSEDCLYLNIYAPLDSDGKKDAKSVMLFLHGGGFEYSSGGARVYNAEAMAAKGNVLVVTINYRLGPFGFLATGQGPNDIRGNYGLQDQRQALKWVSENIRYFGGDPNSVTLFGQSAGAVSIAVHLTSGKVADLFHRVILESGPYSIPLKPLDVAVAQADQFAGLLNCAPRDVRCLKSKSPGMITKAQVRYFSQASFRDSFLRKFIPWSPHIDGDEVLFGVMDAFNSGIFVSKPAILGNVLEEGRLYVYSGFGSKVPALQFRFILMGVEPQLASKAYNNYRPANMSNALPEMSTVTTDYVFSCPTRHLARELGRKVPVYTYVFNQAMSMPGAWNNMKHCEGKVCHGGEIPYVFQSAREEPLRFQPDEFRLSDSMIYYWSNFAKTGNPNRFGEFSVPFWPRYRIDGYFPEISMVLESTPGNYGNHLTQRYRGAPCDFWDQSDYKA